MSTQPVDPLPSYPAGQGPQALVPCAVVVQVVSGSQPPLFTVHADTGAQCVALLGRVPGVRHAPQTASGEPKVEVHWRLRSQPP